MKWPPWRRRRGAHEDPIEPMIEKDSGWRAASLESQDLAPYFRASEQALEIYHAKRMDRRYRKPYEDAYKGLITYDEADQAILVLYGIDQARKEKS